MAQEPSIVVDAKYLKEIEKARRTLRALISNKQCAPIMLRLAWHDAATYDAKSKTGGPNGSVKFELNHKLNKGLEFAIDLCESVKANHPTVTYADLYQLAGVVAVEVTGGPSIDFVSGRPDSTNPVEEGRLPDANQGTEHLRKVFQRMGLSDKDIAAVLGGLTVLDNASKARKDPVKFDNSYFKELHKEVKEDASTGVQKFDNSNSKELHKEVKEDTLTGVHKYDNSNSKELKEDDSKGVVELPTDKVVFVQDPVFRRYVEVYAKDEDVFFKDYAESHKKFSELGLIVQSPALITQPPAASAAFITQSPRSRLKSRMNMATKATIGVTVSIIIIGCLYKFTRRAK